MQSQLSIQGTFRTGTFVQNEPLDLASTHKDPRIFFKNNCSSIHMLLHKFMDLHVLDSVIEIIALKLANVTI
jgi:hypothetical protein